jgi:hypothetical protein
MKNFSMTLLSVAAIFIFSQAIFREGYSNRAGAPAGRTGSPFDNGGIACNASGCHTGNPVSNVSGWITSTIPGTGYVPSSTYTITATATSAGLVRFGFEISPQTSTGLQAGTNVITDATNTRLAPTNNPKYVTQTTTGSAANPPGSKTWTFNWVAPTAGTGTVTFYGAFNCANNSNTSTGDLIRLCTLVVSEDITTSWTTPDNNSYAFDVFPNPASGQITLSVLAKQNLKYTADLLDVTGKTVKQLHTDEIISGDKKSVRLNIEDIRPGIYFIMLKSENTAVYATRRIVVL